MHAWIAIDWLIDQLELVGGHIFKMEFHGLSDHVLRVFLAVALRHNVEFQADRNPLVAIGILKENRMDILMTHVYQPRPASNSSFGMEPISRPRIGSPSPRETSAMILGSW